MTPDHVELARLLAGTRASRETRAPRIRALAAACDPAAIAVDLTRRRVLPLLGSRLLELAADELPPAFAAQVAAALAHDRAAGMALQADTLRVVHALAEHGIRALPLKGPGLAERAHGDLGLRDAGDIDVLVAPQDVSAAAAAVRELGYEDQAGIEDLHVALCHAEHPTVELHRRVHWHERSFSQAMLERAEPGTDGVLVPQPADEAASLLLFHARDGLFGLRAPADVAGWWDRHELEPGVLDAYAQRHPELVLAWRSAASALASTAGVPVTAWFTAPHPPSRRVQLAVRLSCWSGRGERDQLVANVALVDGLLAPASALPSFWRRQLHGATGSVATHMAKVLARFAIGLWRVRRRPWDPV